MKGFLQALETFAKLSVRVKVDQIVAYGSSLQYTAWQFCRGQDNLFGQAPSASRSSVARYFHRERKQLSN